MTLSKKNIDKLKSISINDLSNQNKQYVLKSNKIFSENSNDIFYSIIDNSNDINETTLPNNRLKQNEGKVYSKQDKNNKNLSIELTEEDLLYDEFNYLLDEE